VVAASNKRSKRAERLETSPAETQFRFSGHETFACRFAWLPKAYRFAKELPDQWSDDERAMVELGIGKNMVRSLRFWASAAGLVVNKSGKPEVTEFGELIFGPGGLDPYIEHPTTPWIIHWKFASNPDVPLFSWHFMLNKWPFPEFSRSDVLAALRKETGRMGFDHSDITLAQHLDVFMHSYLPSRTNVSLEDSLEGPLTDLALVQAIGEKKVDGSRREAVYSLRRGRKPEISIRLFDYCVDDFWRSRRPHESTVSLRDICVADFSPGRVLLLGEDDVHERLEDTRVAGRPFEYLPSAIAGRIVRSAKAPAPSKLLRLAYGRD
jgi:hypothetical protein